MTQCEQCGRDIDCWCGRCHSCEDVTYDPMEDPNE